mgnify:CR=1 FL=1
MKFHCTFIVLFLSIFLLCTKSIASPAYPNEITVSTFNGKSAIIYMNGDEHQKIAISEDGYTLINDTGDWWYATLLDNGEIGKSDLKLTSKEDETSEIKEFKKNCPKGIIPKQIQVNRINNVTKSNTTIQHAPVTGECRSLVILMQYRDLYLKKTKEDFEALFNSIGYKTDGATGSVRDFYQFASQGQLDYISDIYGPYTSLHPMKYYGANISYGGGDSHPLELCIEAIKNLPKDINYSLYDNNNDGLIDNVHIIFAGYGEEAGASSYAIWSHEYPYRINLNNEIGYSFASYSCTPELRGNNGTKISNIGVICHELGHALGAMDYYDTNYEIGGRYTGTGQWDIMADGSWNNDGKTPPNFNPYVRSTVFGWNKQITLESEEDIIIPTIELSDINKSVIYRINTENDGDYFLLENRQKIGFDSAIPGEGLIIYHVHPEIDRYTATNTINSTHPQCFYPVCASGSDPSTKYYGYINSSSCPFPGSKNKVAFSPLSSPAMLAWDGSYPKLSLYNIKNNTFDKSISFSTKKEATTITDKPSLPIDKYLIYEESFETNISNIFSILSISGKQNWKTYRKGDFVINPENIPKATDKESIFMLYLEKENRITESEAIGPYINIETGNNYTLAIDICAYNTHNQVKTEVNIYIEDEYGEYLVYTSNKIGNKWETIEIPLSFAGNNFRYKINGKTASGGIFIDNIKFYKEDTTNSTTIVNNNANDSKIYIYRLDGSFIGTYDNFKNYLEPNIYLLRKGNRTWKINITR